MSKSENAKLNIGAVLDESLGLDKVPIEYEYDLPDGTFDDPVGKDDTFYPENDDIIIDSNEGYESIDEMIANADSVDELENYVVEEINNDGNEFDEISTSYDYDSLDPEVAVSYEDGYTNKETSYVDDLSEEDERLISQIIHGEDFAKNFDLSENLLDELKNRDINGVATGEMDKLLGGGASEPNLVKELPIFESAAEKILKQQQEKEKFEKEETPFTSPDKTDTSWYSDRNNANLFSDSLGEQHSAEEMDGKGETLGAQSFEGILQGKENELPIDDNLPEFLKAYIDKDIEKEKNETEKQVKPVVTGDKKMDENKTMDNEIKKDNLTENLDLAVASSPVVENDCKNENSSEDVKENDNVVVVDAKNKDAVDSVVNEQIKKTVNNNIEKSQKDGVVRVCVDDGSVVCDVCGHLNKKASGVCEMCSNYLKVRR